MIVARKPGKLPGEILEKNDLEVWKNSLSIQKKPYKNLVLMQLLMTYCYRRNCQLCLEILRLINKSGKFLNKFGLLTVVELIELKKINLLNLIFLWNGSIL